MIKLAVEAGARSSRPLRRTPEVTLDVFRPIFELESVLSSVCGSNGRSRKKWPKRKLNGSRSKSGSAFTRRDHGREAGGCEHLAAEKHDADDGRLEARVALHTVRMCGGRVLQLVARAQQAVLELAGVHKLLDARRLELLKASADRGLNCFVNDAMKSGGARVTAGNRPN